MPATPPTDSSPKDRFLLPRSTGGNTKTQGSGDWLQVTQPLQHQGQQIRNKGRWSDTHAPLGTTTHSGLQRAAPLPCFSQVCDAKARCREKGQAVGLETWVLGWAPGVGRLSRAPPPTRAWPSLNLSLFFKMEEKSQLIIETFFIFNVKWEHQQGHQC